MWSYKMLQGWRVRLFEKWAFTQRLCGALCEMQSYQMLMPYKFISIAQARWADPPGLVFSFCVQPWPSQWDRLKILCWLLWVHRWMHNFQQRYFDWDRPSILQVKYMCGCPWEKAVATPWNEFRVVSCWFHCRAAVVCRYCVLCMWTNLLWRLEAELPWQLLQTAQEEEVYPA